MYCLVAFQTKPPKVIVRDDQDDSRSKDEGLGDTTESRTDDLSKSDTHEEVSEIALDNTSTHRYEIHPQRNSAVKISQSSLDDLNNSDTHEKVSEIALDNTSTHLYETRCSVI